MQSTTVGLGENLLGITLSAEHIYCNFEFNRSTFLLPRKIIV